MQNLRKKICLAILICLVGSVVFGSGIAAFPHAAHAQAQNPATVPTGTGWDPQSILTYLKNFVLDHLATLVAKQILHQITLSVINWINSGYKGQPGFITNPAQFFENAADQVTGAFIAGSGPLSQLCSPFSVNIRVGLALQQSQFSNQKYACTLDSIIQNASNLPNNIYVNGQRVGGPSIGGFMAGNFSQGGWPAFIALTTEPQNNAYGAYLQSASDLRTQIALRQGALTFDLQLGQGFLSWNSCSDITSQIATDDQETNLEGLSNNGVSDAQLTQAEKQLLMTQNKNQTFQTGQDQFGNAQSIQEQVDPKSGATTYQNCTTQTPGSVIASKLFTNVNAPEVELELANDINAVINAAISQMVTQMLSKGLFALSGGGATSYTQQALQSIETQTQTGVKNAQTQASDYISLPATSALNSEKASYDSAVLDASSTAASFMSVRQCFSGLLQSGSLTTYQLDQAEGDTAAIDSYVATSVTPTLINMTAKDAAVDASIYGFSTATTNITSATPATTDDVENELPTIEGAVQSSASSASSAAKDAATAQQDLTNTRNTMRAANAVAAQYAAACQALPSTLAAPPQSPQSTLITKP